MYIKMATSRYARASQKVKILNIIQNFYKTRGVHFYMGGGLQPKSAQVRTIQGKGVWCMYLMDSTKSYVVCISFLLNLIGKNTLI